MLASTTAEDDPVAGMVPAKLFLVQTEGGEWIGFPFDQEGTQLRGGGLVQFLGEELQFAQEVMIAEGPTSGG